MSKPKICKVFASCFRFGSPRNNSPPNPEASLSFIKKNIENEKQINSGLDLDVMIINQNTGFESGNKFLQEINGQKSSTGKFITETIENKFSPFDAYNYAFLKYKDQYDYWIFLEDDHLIFAENYAKNAFEEFCASPNIGFLAFAPISPCLEYVCPFCGKNAAHSGGGFGLTSTENLQQICEFFKKTTNEYSLSTINLLKDIRWAEILFTHSFYHINKTIKLIDKYSCYASNKEMVADHMVNFHRKLCLDNENYFFQVGIKANENWV